MKHFQCLEPTFGLRVAKHVEGDTALEDFQGSYSIDGLLHFAVSPVTAFNGVGGRRQGFIVQERQCFFQRRREQLLEGFADLLETADTSAQLGEFLKRSMGSAAAVKKTINLVHDRSGRAQLPLPAADLSKPSYLGHRQAMLDKEVAVFEEVANLFLEPLLRSSAPCCRAGTWTTARYLGDVGTDRLAYLCDRPQDRLGQLRDDVELANLVRYIAKELGNRLWIKGRCVCCEAKKPQLTAFEDHLETLEELSNVVMCWVVVKYFVQDPLEAAIVHDREHPEGAVVQLIGGNVAREVTECPIQVVPFEARFTFFPPMSRPSSERWQRARRHDGRARDARTLHGMKGRPRRPIGQRLRPPYGCSCFQGEQDLRCPR